MRTSSLLGALASVALLIVACGGGVGIDGKAVGGACAANADCAGGSRCQVGGNYPQGMCVVNCSADTDCPTGSRCASRDSGVCLPTCARNDECRANYTCKDDSGRDGGKILVCRKD